MATIISPVDQQIAAAKERLMALKKLKKDWARKQPGFYRDRKYALLMALFWAFPIAVGVAMLLNFRWR